MNKSLWISLAWIGLWIAPALRAQTIPPFSPEPPDPVAAALVNAYLGLLAEGHTEDAIGLTDLRGMRQYLLDKRLADLKAKNPELTAKDLDDMSAQLQVAELNPARLRQILLDVLTEGNYAGMTWKIRGFAPAPDGIDGYLASIDALTAVQKEKPILLGLVKLGDQWLVSPAVIERLMGNRPVVRVGQSNPPPPEVSALIDGFWKRFQSGELDAAYADMGGAYRARVPLLAFLGQAQNFISKAGVPASWSIVQGVQPEPQSLFVGVNVQGSTAAQPTLMGFKKMGQTWVVEDVQFEMPRPRPTAPSAAAGPSPVSRPDLRPNLSPNLGATPLPHSPNPPPAPSSFIPPKPSEPPGRATPSSPVGPDQP